MLAEERRSRLIRDAKQVDKRDIVRRLGKTVILVTHDLAEAAILALLVLGVFEIIERLLTPRGLRLQARAWLGRRYCLPA